MKGLYWWFKRIGRKRGKIVEFQGPEIYADLGGFYNSVILDKEADCAVNLWFLEDKLADVDIYIKSRWVLSVLIFLIFSRRRFQRRVKFERDVERAARV